MHRHIQKLEELCATEQDGSYSAALTTAIDLMRAATPKDEAAERERLVDEANRWGMGRRPSNENLVDMLMRLRAEARAEGFALGQENAKQAQGPWGNPETKLAAAQSEVDRARELAELQTKLGYAQAKTERVEHERDEIYADLASKRAKLAAAQAEIGRLTEQLSASKQRGERAEARIAGLLSLYADIKTKLYAAQVDLAAVEDRLRAAPYFCK